MEHYLIVGLGNPGEVYEGTRHNIGFRVVKALAEKRGAHFRPALAQVKGMLAQTKVEEKNIFLLMPLTYMNESGLAVRKCLDYFSIALDHCLIIVDDIALPLGSFRLRRKGSSGGHNGLKSVEAHLGSDEYARLRIGIGRVPEQPLADYVLSRFNAQEEKELPEVIQRALELVDAWMQKSQKQENENG
jgi:PTH1 family peptidyl-tRNA hydrolase